MAEPGGPGNGADAPPGVVAPLLNSIPMVITRTGLSRGSIYEVIKAGRLATVKFGTRTLITELELRRFADAIAAGQYADGLRGLADKAGAPARAG